MTDVRMMGRMAPRLSFSLPLEPPRLLRARRRIHDYLDSHGISSPAIDDVVLAVEEAMTNAVRHSRAQENLEVHLGLIGSDLFAEVCDRGVGFDVERVDRDAVPDPLALDGRGLYMIGRLMDAMELHSDGHGLTVRMRKADVVRAEDAEARERTVPDAEMLVPDLSYRDERLRTVIEEIAEGFAALDWEYRFIYANDFSLRMYGMARDEVVGKSAWEIFPYLRENELGRALRDAMEYGTPAILDYESPHIDRVLEYRIYPTRAGLSFYARDITERKRRERERDELFAELQVSEARFRAVFDGNPDAGILAHPSGPLVAVNAAACRMFGYTEGEFRTLLHPDILDEADPRLATAFVEREATGFVQGVELTGIRKGGARFPLEMDSVILPGTPQLVWVVYRDITARKRAENALRASEERFRVALRNAPVSVAAQDLELVYTWAYNQQTAANNRIVGRRDADIFTPAEAAHVTAVKRRVIDEEIEYREQLWLERPSGRRYYDITWAPLYDEDGRVVGVSSATVDLTEERLAVEKSLAQSDELQIQSEALWLSRERLDQELARVRLLQDVAAAASAELDVQDIAERTLEALRTHLQLKGGDIRHADRGLLRLVASFGYPEENRELLQSVELATSDLLGARAAREDLVLTHEDETPSPGRRRLLERQGILGDRYVYVPIAHSHQVLGLLSLTFAGRRGFHDDELLLFKAIAATLGQAFENAGLFDEQRHIAETLQGYLMHPLPEVPGLEFAATSLPASLTELIGGDFSDVSRLPDGRALVIIGDVSGKGIQAAGMTETVRSTLRAFASIDATPAFILRKSNEVLLRNGRGDPYVTALVCVIDPATGRVTMASAGHPPPVHLSRDSGDIIGLTYGPPLGAFPADYQTIPLILSPGDSLVLCTDGVTEARRDGELFGDERLIEVVRDLRTQDPGVVARGLADAVVAYGGSLRDDVNIVVVKRS